MSDQKRQRSWDWQTDRRSGSEYYGYTTVEKHWFLGCVFDMDGISVSEVNKRIGNAKSCFIKVKKVLTKIRMDFTIRMRLLKSFVW